MWRQYPEVLKTYLNVDLYDEWYDEVLFACGLSAELTADRDTTAFASRLAALLDGAQKKGIPELIELAAGVYERRRRF